MMSAFLPNDDEALINYAKPIVAELRANMVRVDADFSATPFKAKIANAEQLRVHPAVAGLVIGGHDPAVRDRRGERASPPRRPARRKAEGGSDGGYSGEHQRAADVSCIANFGVRGGVAAGAYSGRMNPFRFLFAMLLLASRAFANDPGGGTNGVGANVTLSYSGGNATLGNGVLAAVIATSSAQVTSYLFYGTQMLDTSGKIYYSMDGGTSYENPGNCVYSVTTSNADMVDISCKVTWANNTNRVHAFDIDCHYVLRRGDTGLYAYAILSHPASYPATSVGEWRIVWKLPHSSTDWTFERIYADAIRNWYWGKYTDFTSAQSTSIAEVVKLTTGARAGQYDCKYEYSLEYQNAGCWGHASDTNKIGVWLVLGGYDYLNDGPIKNDLALAESYMLQHFGRNHYNSSSTSCSAGETWSKIYGPFLLYCDKTATNSNPGNNLWADAKAQVAAEISAWPYAWLTNSDYPAANQRGAVSGKLIISDALKPALAAGTNTWIGLSQPDAGGNWQFESKRYQSWVHPDTNGNFFIPFMRPGSYTLSAFTDGAVGEFTYSNSVTVTANTTNALGNLTWAVPHPGGQIIWEIGIADRRAGEFRHSTNYWYPFLWETCSNDFPNPLEYTNGVSNWSNDWNYAHPGYLVGTNWSAWKWRIHFNLTNLPTSGSATLTFAFASINYGAVQVFVNDESTLLGEVATTTAGGGTGGNALIREGNHAKYSLGYFSVPLSSLRVGSNIVTLVQRRSSASSDHVMYDYLNLELPAVATLPPGRPLTWRGGNSGNAWDLNTTANWVDTNNAATVFTNGDNVLFDNTSGTNPTPNVSVALTPASVSVISSSNFTFSGVGSFNGTMQLIKAGSGNLTVNTTNSFTGQVSLSAGKIIMGNAGASLGSGTLQMNGGTIQLASGGTLANPVNVVAPSTVTTSGNTTFGAAIAGSSTLTVTSGNVLTFQSVVTGFTGTVAMGNSTGYLRFNQGGTQGVPNGTVDAGTNTAKIENRLTGGGTIYLGALTGGTGTKLIASDQSSNPGTIDTYVVGALNLDSTFAGTISDFGQAQLLALTKVGAGTWTLSGTNIYSGRTSIGAGTLQILGSITTTNVLVVSNTATLDLPGSLATTTLQINAGGTLTGCGTLTGNLLNNGTVLANCGGTMQITGNVTNNGTMQFLSGSGLAVTGTFVNNGLLDLLSGAQALPVNFINNGTVLLATNIVVTSFTKTGGSISLTIYGYDDHTYQLQRTATLNNASWQNIGPSQDGTGAPITFTDSPGGGQNFYRVAVSP